MSCLVARDASGGSAWAAALEMLADMLGRQVE